MNSFVQVRLVGWPKSRHSHAARGTRSNTRRFIEDDADVCVCGRLHVWVLELASKREGKAIRCLEQRCSQGSSEAVFMPCGDPPPPALVPALHPPPHTVQHLSGGHWELRVLSCPFCRHHSPSSVPPGPAGGPLPSVSLPLPRPLTCGTPGFQAPPPCL